MRPVFRQSDLRLESGLDLVASRPKLRVLRYLARRGERLTGREIARVTGSAWARTSKALKDMVDAGLLIHRRVGRAIEYRLNEQHYLIRGSLRAAGLVPGHGRRQGPPHAAGEAHTDAVLVLQRAFGDDDGAVRVAGQLRALADKKNIVGGGIPENRDVQGMMTLLPYIPLVV